MGSNATGGQGSHLGTTPAPHLTSDVSRLGLTMDLEHGADYIFPGKSCALSNDNLLSSFPVGSISGASSSLDQSSMTGYLYASQFMQRFPVEVSSSVRDYDGSYLSYTHSPVQRGASILNQSNSSLSDQTSYTSYMATPTRLSFNTDNGSPTELMTSSVTSASDYQYQNQFKAPPGDYSTGFTHSTPVFNKQQTPYSQETAMTSKTDNHQYHFIDSSVESTDILDTSPSLNLVHKNRSSDVSISPCEPDACAIRERKRTDTHQMTSSATWQDLCSAVQQDCKGDSIPYGLLQKCENQTFQVPLSVRVSLLQLQFTKLSTKYKTKVADLQFNYQLEAAKLESQRYQTLLRAALTPWQINGINNYFDQRHTAVIDSLEQKLEQFADTAEQEAPSSGKARFTVSLNTTAVKIMERYYNRNKEHPYPSYSTAESLATAGGITVEQVKKWFANRRMRDRNTKKLSDIAHRRKVTKSPGVDSLFVGITPRD